MRTVADDENTIERHLYLSIKVSRLMVDPRLFCHAGYRDKREARTER